MLTKNVDCYINKIKSRIMLTLKENRTVSLYFKLLLSLERNKIIIFLPVDKVISIIINDQKPFKILISFLIC